MLKKPDLMDFLPKQGGATPTPPKPQYKMPESPIVTEVKKNQDATKAQSEATAKANLEKKQRYNRESVSQLNIKTKYGTAVVPYKGFKALSIDEQRALNSKLKAEIEAKEDAKRKPEDQPKPTVDPYNPGEAVPMKSDFEIARDMYNNSQVVSTIQDLSPLRLGGKMLDKAVPNASKRVQDFGKALQVSTEQKDMGTTGLLAIPEFLGRQAVNIPGQIVEGVGTIMNPKTDNAGVAQAGIETAANIVPAYMSGKAGFAAYRAAKSAGTPALQALAKGVGTAVADSAGFNHSPESPNVQQVKESLGMGDGIAPIATKLRNAGVFKTPAEEEAFKQLWTARANTWASEAPGRNVSDFYQQFSVAVDQQLPQGALLQDSGTINASASGLERRLPSASVPVVVKDAPTQKIAFSIADQAKVGDVTLPSGATFKTYGGPAYRINEFDPLAGDGNAWASSKRNISDAHHKRAAQGAELQFTINNSPENVFGSHGVEAVRAEIEHAILNKKVSKRELLAHIQKSVAKHNTSRSASTKIPIPKTVDEFLQNMDANLNTFASRADFAKKFWSAPMGKTATNPFGTRWEDVARLMSEGDVADRGSRSVMNALQVDPKGVAALDSAHPIYPWSIKGQNLGLTTATDIKMLAPDNLVEEAISSLKKQGRLAPSEAEVNNRVSGWLLTGDGGRGIVQGGIVEVPTERVLKFFAQDANGDVKGFYEATNKTLGFWSGKSDFSTAVHESFHAWTDSLKDAHKATLEANFGKIGTTEYYEGSARAFERYLRNGQAPTKDLKQIFETIKDTMRSIYARIKGTPLEGQLNPEVKQVFDEMLGGGKTKPTPETPGVTTSAPMADLQPNTTGISNAANLDDVEAGLLSEVAKGEGKSAKAVYESNRGREDYLEVAKRVRNGAPLNAEDTATLLAGGQKLTKRVYDTREAVKVAIANGADQATITRLNNDYAEARRVKDEFTQDVQRGKSSWSDVGRVLAQKVEVDTGDIAQVMEEARIRKGAELTDKESIALKKKVEELQANAVESDKRISDLMDQLVKAQEATRVTRRAGMSRVQTASVREQAKTRFTEARSKAKSVASLNALQGITDPDVIKSFKEYVNAVMDDGARSIQDIVDQMAKDGVTADGEDIYKAFTDKTGMRKLSDIQKEISKARREIVKDAVQGPNITPAQKKIRARIAELENQIKTGDYIEAQPKIKREIDAEVYRLQQIKKMKDAQVKDALEQMRPKSKSEKLNALSSELKLLNPISRLKDVISNTANLTSTMVETPVRYAVDRITARIAGQDPIMMVKGSRESAGIANDRIAATVKTDLASAWQGLDASATEKFGFTRGIGGRSAGVTDSPFKTVYREYANVGLAEEKARRILPKNATRGDIQNMRDSILANLDDHPDVKLGAEDIALYKTFNNQNAISKFNAMAKRGLNNDTATGFYDELIGRFSKVITNVNLDRLDRTGFGVVRGFTKLLRNKETLTVAERMIINDMISKGLVGMPIVATGYLMSDKIPAEIKDGYRKYIDRGDLGDIGGVVAAFLYGADMKAAEKEGKDANELRFSTTAGLALDNPMSTNLADLFGLMKDPTASGFVDYAAKKATNLIPGGIRETARRMDEPNMQGVPAMVRPQSGQAKEREKYPRGTKARVNKLSADEKSAQAILDMILGEGKSKIPYLRQTLPEK